MTKFTTLLALAAGVVVATISADSAQAIDPYNWAGHRAACTNWHGGYAHSAYGQPVALVVPPTAQLQTNWGWGVGSSRISRIDHQFGRDYPGQGGFGGGGFQMTPRWPHDTTNMGVYYVRGPW
ncbi:hypothetical protein [Aeoliella mucimassa]|uniref:Uncharacterized protein n=1 Tax=Aeoliella mucimassa TaxID=2527972 RepID=A0A518AIF7_9BACT|nr:hypothetical protein [Aeoliella mucimassa]QDU54509.1 hypothetical protein Pan181_06910 [Aeoliella mucimassa]